MLLSEIIWTIKKLYDRVPTDESDLTEEHVEKWINQWRAKLLRQELSDNKTVGSVHEQTICLVTSRLEKTEKNYLKICRSYKTTKFPALLNTRFGDHVARVAERPLEPSYKLTTFKNLPYLLQARLTSRTPKAILEDSRLYIYSADAIEEVYLTGIFEDPRAVQQFVGLEDPFHPFDFEYPLSEVHLDGLYRGIMDTNFRILKSTIPDLLNDGHSPTNPQ